MTGGRGQRAVLPRGVEPVPATSRRLPWAVGARPAAPRRLPAAWHADPSSHLSSRAVVWAGLATGYEAHTVRAPSPRSSSYVLPGHQEWAWWAESADPCSAGHVNILQHHCRQVGHACEETDMRRQKPICSVLRSLFEISIENSKINFTREFF